MQNAIEILKARQLNNVHEITILPVDERFQNQVDELIRVEWSGPLIISKGKVIDTSKNPGFVAVDGEKILGCVTYHITNNECEITTLNSFSEGQGVGAALINAVISAAKQANCRRLWLVTTNDNTHAIRFYQRFGFSLGAVHMNALNRSRELKPSIPMTGTDGIPLLHEFEFEMRL